MSKKRAWRLSSLMVLQALILLSWWRGIDVVRYVGDTYDFATFTQGSLFVAVFSPPSSPDQWQGEVRWSMSLMDGAPFGPDTWWGDHKTEHAVVVAGLPVFQYMSGTLADLNSGAPTDGQFMRIQVPIGNIVLVIAAVWMASILWRGRRSPHRGFEPVVQNGRTDKVTTSPLRPSSTPDDH